LEKELELLPPMKANLAELCSNIGELSRRVDRLELALDMAHDINEQRQKAEWLQQRDQDISQLKAQQQYGSTRSCMHAPTRCYAITCPM
jgi:chromosome segregation ATPase